MITIFLLWCLFISLFLNWLFFNINLRIWIILICLITYIFSFILCNLIILYHTRRILLCIIFKWVFNINDQFIIIPNFFLLNLYIIIYLIQPSNYLINIDLIIFLLLGIYINFRTLWLWSKLSWYRGMWYWVLWLIFILIYCIPIVIKSTSLY